MSLSRFHTGMWAGEWLIVTRYASWDAYGRTQEAVAKDEAFAKLPLPYRPYFETARAASVINHI
jgi:hypothetical protein